MEYIISSLLEIFYLPWFFEGIKPYERPDTLRYQRPNMVNTLYCLVTTYEIDRKVLLLTYISRD